LTEYALYLESGPRRRKTMVHVIDLLGCIAQGSTTEEALGAAPEAIRAYLRFLLRHGEPVEPERAFTTAVAAHVMEGNWLANGDPTPGFAPDFGPLRAEDLSTYLRRLDWLLADLQEQVRTLPPEQMAAEPEGGGRSIGHILQHVVGSQGVYLRYLVGPVGGLSEVLRAAEQDPQAAPSALSRLWQISKTRLNALTAAECAQAVQHGQVTWTARRALRRMLEHAWEHLQEISHRLDFAKGETKIDS
jgi:predicted RNase H-like HicB family nuclease/uncharacterized damage-inducible protein DinB